jgi:hypothetical protein
MQYPGYINSSILMKQKKKVLHASMLTEPSIGIENQLLDEYEARKPDVAQWDVRILITYISDIEHPMYVKSSMATSKKFAKYSLARILYTRIMVFSYFSWFGCVRMAFSCNRVNSIYSFFFFRMVLSFTN